MHLVRDDALILFPAADSLQTCMNPTESVGVALAGREVQVGSPEKRPSGESFPSRRCWRLITSHLPPPFLSTSRSTVTPTPVC